jgi:phage gp29-like protein
MAEERKMVRKLLTVAILGLLIQGLVIGSAFAQDFGSLISQATSANRLWVSQIDQALQATDLATLQARAATALTTGQQVQSLLQSALALAPDDASRSRVQAVLTHVAAAIQSGRQVAQATDFDTARSRLDAERGEAQEALNELAPFAPQVTPTPAVTPVTVTPVPAALPTTGGVPVGPVVLGGLATLLAGLGIRGRSR